MMTVTYDKNIIIDLNVLNTETAEIWWKKYCCIPIDYYGAPKGTCDAFLKYFFEILKNISRSQNNNSRSRNKIWLFGDLKIIFQFLKILFHDLEITKCILRSRNLFWGNEIHFKIMKSYFIPSNYHFEISKSISFPQNRFRDLKIISQKCFKPNKFGYFKIMK